jgi:hypothetical protein
MSKHRKLARFLQKRRDPPPGPPKMSAAMARLWARPLEPRNMLEEARRRELGTDSKTLYPARPGTGRNSRNSEKD